MFESLWLFAVAGGAILLGLGIAWGVMRSRQETRSEIERGEEATREIYDKSPEEPRQRPQDPQH